MWQDRFGAMASRVDHREDFAKKSTIRAVIIRYYILGEMVSKVDHREDFPKRSTIRAIIINYYILKSFLLRQESLIQSILKSRSMSASKSHIIPGPSNPITV